MDHLPLPSNPAYLRPSIPYLDTYTYDADGDWATYPDRLGFSTIALRTGDYDPATHNGRAKEETAALLQTWLFFGVLSEVLGGRVGVREWTRREGGTQVLDSSGLLGRLEEWEGEIQGLNTTKEVRRQRLGRASKCLQTACEVLNNAFVAPETWPLSLEATLAVRVLVDTVTQMDVLWLYNEEDEAELGGEGFRRVVYEQLPDWLVRRRMEEGGWCVNEREGFEAAGVSVALLATEVRVQPPAAVGVVGKDGDLHARCKRGGCVAFNIEEGAYRTKHVEEGCTCVFLGPDGGYVEVILKAGGYPVIEASREGDEGEERVQMKAVKFEPGMQYVAISHVWSDGLGNATATTLPTCQLLKLVRTLEALLPPNTDPAATPDSPQTVIFWLDTLCVPHGPELKNKAITLMNETYTAATHVLVLSAPLQCVPHPETPEEELVHILRSAWMARVWTLQEACLAQSLVVEWEDGFSSLSALFDFFAANVFRYRTVVKAALSSAFTPLVRRLTAHLDPVTMFGQIWEAMQTRSTSKRRDALIVFAILLGMQPVGGLLSHDADTQAVAFFRGLPGGEVPRALLFSNIGRRVARAGWRWAPAGVLGRRGLVGDWSSAKIEEGGGLVVRAAGYVFKPERGLKREFLVKEKTLPTSVSVRWDPGEEDEEEGAVGGVEGEDVWVDEEERDAEVQTQSEADKRWAALGPKANSGTWGILTPQPVAAGAAAAIPGILVRVTARRPSDGVYESVYVANVGCDRSQTVFSHDLPWAEPGARERVFERMPALRELIADAVDEGEALEWCVR